MQFDNTTKLTEASLMCSNCPVTIYIMKMNVFKLKWRAISIYNFFVCLFFDICLYVRA